MSKQEIKVGDLHWVHSSGKLVEVAAVLPEVIYYREDGRVALERMCKSKFLKNSSPKGIGYVEGEGPVVFNNSNYDYINLDRDWETRPSSL